jgi:lipid-A-disaccharide synthase
MDKPVVKELIQNELTVENLSNELRLIIENETYRNNILNDYDNLKSTLSKGGDASLNAANIIVKFLQQQGSFNQ